MLPWAICEHSSCSMSLPALGTISLFKLSLSSACVEWFLVVVQFSFPQWLISLIIPSYAYWPFTYFLSWNACYFFFSYFKILCFYFSIIHLLECLLHLCLIQLPIICSPPTCPSTFAAFFGIGQVFYIFTFHLL